MEYQEIKTLKEMVKYCLENYSYTRNSDISLTIQIWNEFYPSKVSNTVYTEQVVKLKDLYYLPREDNVKRIRAYFQNERKKYLPTILKVAEKRGININEWRVAMGYPTKETIGDKVPSWIPQSEQNKLI